MPAHAPLAELLYIPNRFRGVVNVGIADAWDRCRVVGFPVRNRSVIATKRGKCRPFSLMSLDFEPGQPHTFIKVGPEPAADRPEGAAIT